MPLPRDLLEEMAEKRRRETVLADRDRRRDLLLSSLLCVCWCAAGVFCIAWSAHTTDLTYGRAAFAAGIGIGNGGIIFTLLGVYRRGERRGDW